jgi:hypothetical protein
VINHRNLGAYAEVYQHKESAKPSLSFPSSAGLLELSHYYGDSGDWIRAGYFVLSAKGENSHSGMLIRAFVPFIA